MIRIKHDPDRPAHTGQYLLEMISHRVEGNQRTQEGYNRVGYYCDRPHLSHIFRELVKQIGPETARAILESTKYDDPILPPVTCPDIDKALEQVNCVVQEVEHVKTYLENLRQSNTQLRYAAVYWEEVAKSKAHENAGPARNPEDPIRLEDPRG